MSKLFMAQNAPQGKRTAYYIPVKVIGGSTASSTRFGKLAAYNSSNQIIYSKVIYRSDIEEYETSEYITVTLPIVSDYVRFKLIKNVDELEYTINNYGLDGNSGDIVEYFEQSAEQLDDVTDPSGVPGSPIMYIWYKPIKRYEIPIPTDYRDQFTIGEMGFVGDIQIGSWNNNSEDEDNYEPLCIIPAGNNTSCIMIPQDNDKFGNFETLSDAIIYETQEGEQVETDTGWKIIADIEPTWGSAHFEGYVPLMTSGCSAGDITWS